MGITINGREATKREMDIIERALEAFRERIVASYEDVVNEQPNSMDVPSVVVNHGYNFRDEIATLREEVNEARREYVTATSFGGAR